MRISSNRARAIFVARALVVSAISAASAQQQPLTVRDAIDTTRIFVEVQGNGFANHAEPASFSPDGHRYVVRLLQGDVSRDGDWLETIVGGADSLPAAKRVRTVSKLFTHGFEFQPHNRFLLNENINPISWLNDNEVAFRWEDSHQVAQVVVLNLNTGTLNYLSHSRTNVGFFDIGPHEQVLYAADDAARDETVHDEYGGTYVTAADANAITAGRMGAGNFLGDAYDRRFYIERKGAAKPVLLDARSRALGFRWGFKPLWSGNGQFVLLEAWAPSPPEEWKAFSSVKAGELFRTILHDAYSDPLSWYARNLSEFYVVDTFTGRSRPLWNAPAAAAAERIHGAWSIDGKAVVLGPTILPADSASHVQETLGVVVVNVATGQYVEVAVPEAEFNAIEAIEWPSKDMIRVTLKSSAMYFRQIDGSWKLDKTLTKQEPEARIQIKVKEDLNAPPVLYAKDRMTDDEEVILDPNPDLRRRFILGKVSRYECRDSKGHTYSGVLYLPPEFKKGTRYPLVIQISSAAAALSNPMFDLYGVGTGAGLGPGPSIYSAQLLANHGMIVVSMPRAGVAADPNEVRDNNHMLETVIADLDQAGYIDKSKVGLAGISRPGWLVAQALVHSDFPFAAAIVSDAFDSGYVTQTLFPAASTLENGGPPFGANFATWLERSPDFNADRIRTPLRLEDESEPGGMILVPWELFERMRALHLPVEYYLIPNLDRGSHILQNPNQLVAVKQGAVDWFDFWLNGHIDPDPRKADQYRRWEKLRSERDAAVNVPRPAELHWNATPIRP